MIDHIKQVFTLEISYKTACGPAVFTVPQNAPGDPYLDKPVIFISQTIRLDNRFRIDAVV